MEKIAALDTVQYADAILSILILMRPTFPRCSCYFYKEPPFI